LEYRATNTKFVQKVVDFGLQVRFIEVVAHAVDRGEHQENDSSNGFRINVDIHSIHRYCQDSRNASWAIDEAPKIILGT
jgi:hypothetical protein